VRTLAIASVLATVFASGACSKGKPTYKAPAPTKVEEPHATAGSAAVDRKGPLALPPISGKAPVKTTKPLDVATITELAKKTFPGFQIDVRGHTDNAVEIRQKTEDHPKFWATITIQPCSASTECLPMDLAKWQADTKVTKQFLPDLLQKAPDTTFQVGTTTLGGQTMIYVYQLGQSFNAEGGTFSDAYALYYNDGVNEARVVAEYKDDPLKTKDDMAKVAPQEELAKIATSFMDVYTQAW
jgi:hypothetical protein